MASREVQIPNVKASKIEALVKTNANDYFPVDLTQYEIGHYLAGGLTEEGKLRVMALAVPKACLLYTSYIIHKITPFKGCSILF